MCVCVCCVCLSMLRFVCIHIEKQLLRYIQVLYGTLKYRLMNNIH